MRMLSAVALIAALALPSVPARADGLVYQLPDDGASVEFEMKMSMEQNGMTMDYDGTFWMSSVGKQDVDGTACRWIEFKMVMKQEGRERFHRAKVLIPEAELARGKSPISHAKKGWYQPDDREPREITDFFGNDAGPLPAFLSGPLKDAKELEAETIDSKLGKLECKGVTGLVQFKQSGRDNEVTFTNRLNDKAPFGVVNSEIRFEMSRDGQQQGAATMKIKLSKVGKEAKSDLPDLN